MRKLVFILFSLFEIVSYAQVVYTDPGIPVDSKPVIVYFNASEGSGGLENYTGDIYAHTGVITDKSTGTSDWKYVKTEWGVNIPACKLTRISTNLYKLELTPAIRSYYGVPESETILQLAFVFRSADATREGKGTGGTDIFVDVATDEFSVAFIYPDASPLLIDPTQSITFKASASDTADLSLTINNSTVHSVNDINMEFSYQFIDPGTYTAIIKAEKDGNTDYDTTLIFVRDTPVEKSRPEGVIDGINYISDQSVTLVLYAPYKQHVYLIGDFNNWVPSSDYQLYKDGDYWWITLNNLTPGIEYAYQYLIDDGLLIADPYTEKVLDPWNDGYISESVYPNLKPYPAGKTTGIVSVLQPGKINYEWKITNYELPEVSDLVIYELLIRDFVESHTIKEVRTKLDYLKSLGVNTIELMPFNEFEGNSSWGYNPSFFFAPDKYYGTEGDYKEFIDSCHAKGMIVIMDMVLNHAYGQNPMVQMYFENGNPSPQNPWFNVTSPNTLFSWGYDFNHESPTTQYFVDRVTDHWLNDYNLDGFRFDFTKGFTNTPGTGQAYDLSRIKILERIYDKMKEQKPEAYMICEHLADNSEETVLANHGILLWGNMNYAYGENAMGYVTTSNLSWASYKTRGWNNPNLVSYMESHDEERLMYKCLTWGNSNGNYSVKDPKTALKRIGMAASLFFTIPGPKMMWQFEELGYDYSIDYNGRIGEKPIVWSYLEDTNRVALKNTFSRLINLKTQNPIFKTTDFTTDIGAKSIKKIILNDNDTAFVVVASNTDVSNKSSVVSMPMNGWWWDAFTGDSIAVANGTLQMDLSAGQFKILSSYKLNGAAQKGTIIDTPYVDPGKIKIYPNPATDKITVECASEILKIKIYDRIGRLIEIKKADNTFPVMNTNHFISGLYYLQAQTSSGIITSPFIIIH
ncbi:alpha-amylase family glycosyl hydrolase [Saccharicrinis sp. FJH62]|uniref:alpha-amylase family glycosyl hydrolase n=1 Tax=Saccharicrinis sp. FJH62 TaxID=3344657 RepID=UPI0035D507DF